jgi:hypothetical protein
MLVSMTARLRIAILSFSMLHRWASLQRHPRALIGYFRSHQGLPLHPYGKPMGERPRCKRSGNDEPADRAKLNEQVDQFVEAVLPCVSQHGENDQAEKHIPSAGNCPENF